MDSLNTNYILNRAWTTGTAYTDAARSLNLNEGGLIIDSDRINIPYTNINTHINTDNIIGSWNTILKQECGINTYNEAMEFTKSDEESVCIKSSVLEELINRIKELEETNAKNWAELLKENV